MRILNIDGHYFVKPFRKMGHDVLTIGPRSNSDIVLSKAISLRGLLRILEKHNFHPDLVVWSDICKPPSVLGFEALPAITVGYSIDQYCNPWHAPYRAAFDLMLVAQKDYLPMFEDKQLHNKYEWAPLFCNPHKDKNLNQERDIPSSFVGTVEGSINKARRSFLNAFKKGHPLIITQGNYVPIYNRSQIVLNQSAVGELNFRIFEAMACGAVVLTEDTNNGLHDLFTNGKNILLYPRGNPMAAATIAKTALSSPDELNAIACRGRREVMAYHSSTVRAKYILSKVHELANSGPTWRLQNQSIIRKYMANTCNMLAVDEALPLTEDHREFYIQVGKQMQAASI
ncbi:glycosyltransferase [Pseudodesulfovibrio sp. zrk46]|uniref:glycosyltransferase family protein n=1 Tax=Pseudodesulfovibrio sp. zrk46 TaxID=2725288 RepID=UPI001449D468|nr:glycosyltransferase [Pseudodesulfovibrio sp. zrk46]QJB57773.1 glycosyltransferase family 1 protein [Pseudodesulfovibrio sp. zrk46]